MTELGFDTGKKARRVTRADAQRLGMPLIVWAYPRGSAIEAKGGKDSFYAVDYAARTAAELGADVVKVNVPHPEKRTGVKPEYDVDVASQAAIDASGTGLIFGRNVWQRGHDGSLRFVDRLKEILAKYPSPPAHPDGDPS